MDSAADMGLLGLRILAFGLGLHIVLATVLEAIKAFILPRAAQVPLNQAVFAIVGAPFRYRANRADSYEERDRIMALYAPLALLIVPIVMLSLVLLGYVLLFWSLGELSLRESFILSGSSLLTLGNATVDKLTFKVLEFSEAMLGLILVALLIAYLPTMYSAFTRREAAVAMLEVSAGSPPSPWEFMSRAHRTSEIYHLREVWEGWQIWFAELEESHTSLPALAYFRSPRPDLSWVTAAGVVLDSAALVLSTIGVPFEPRAAYCLRSGYLALRQIANYFQIEYDPDPQPTDAISISQAEFNEVYDEMAAMGIPVIDDRERAWHDYSGWRVNYDRVLIELAALTMAPYAPWTSDRSLAPSAIEGQ